MSASAPAPPPPEGLLDEVLAQTRRAGPTMAAIATAVIAGVVLVLAAVQLWMAVYLGRKYELVPYALIAAGVGLIALGSKMYRQRVWAAIATVVLAAAAAVATGLWGLFVARSGMFSLLALLSPLVCVAAAVCAAAAIGPCARTAAARRRAAAAGLDLDF